MPAEVLGGRVHDDVGAVGDRLDQIRGRDGVVDDERHPGLVRDGRDIGDVEDVVLRVGDGLTEERLGVGRHGRPPRVQVVGVLDEADLDAQLRQRVVEQVVRAAVQPRAGDDVVTGVGEVEDRECLGGLARGKEQRRDPAFECGDALLDDVLGRVHDPGVDVAGLGETEKRRGVLGAVERVRRGLVDRQSPRVGGGIGRLTGVDLFRLERPVGRGVFWRAHRKWTSICSLGVRFERTRACRVAVRFAMSQRLLNLVVSRGTPPRLEGCRPASRGLTLALMTD